MADLITPPISDRICKHMNEDHADAVLLYAKFYGQADNAESAEMKAIDADGMNLAVKTGEATETLRIPFQPALADSQDAHHRLIDMLKAARQQAKA
ncbi:MAG: DUF2470 domain-containing protein [Cyanobacteria bacterium P01_H01_bin.15]